VAVNDNGAFCSGAGCIAEVVPSSAALPSSLRARLAGGSLVEARTMTSQFRPSIKCCYIFASQALDTGVFFLGGSAAGAADEAEDMPIVALVPVVVA